MGQGFVELRENCSDVLFDRVPALVLKKPPQEQVKEEKLVPSSDGSEHLGLKRGKSQ